MKRETHHDDAGPRSNSGRDLALTLRDVSKKFRGRPRSVQAVDEVSLEVRGGQIVALVGPDGAGKTTLMRLAAGLLAPDQGQVRVLGHDVARQPIAAQRRLGYMPQQFGLYTDLTVQENLDLYADLRGQPPAERGRRYEELTKMTGLGPFTRRLAGRLSGGMRQKLGLACVLVRSPELLLLDEPTAGVDPVSRRELWAIIQRLASEEQTGVLLSTGYLDEAERCDEVVVLEQGQVLARGAPGELTQPARGRTYAIWDRQLAPRDLQARLAESDHVIDASVATGHIRVVLADGFHRVSDLVSQLVDARCEQVEPRLEDGIVAMLHQSHRDDSREPPDGDGVPGGQGASGDRASAPGSSPRQGRDTRPSTVIEVRGLKRRFGNFYAVKGLDFDVAAGEVFGLLGANGAGKSTTFRMLCGLLPLSAGSLRVTGVDMRRAPARARARIGYMSQVFSLYGNLTVRENLQFFSSAYGLVGRHRRQRLRWALSEFQLESWQDHPSKMLPLGYRQRLALAAALMHEPQILFLDEPTSGVDPLARREFWRRISSQAARGVTVMVTTHFMQEAEYCDRLAIMMAGELLALGTPQEIRDHGKTDNNPHPTVEDAFIRLIESREEENVAED